MVQENPPNKWADIVLPLKIHLHDKTTIEAYTHKVRPTRIFAVSRENINIAADSPVGIEIILFKGDRPIYATGRVKKVASDEYPPGNPYSSIEIKLSSMATSRHMELWRERLAWYYQMGS